MLYKWHDNIIDVVCTFLGIKANHNFGSELGFVD